MRGGAPVVVSGHCGEKMVLDLKVEVSTEPIIEEGRLNVTGCIQLHVEPVVIFLIVDVHRDVTHLGHPDKPMTLYDPHDIKQQHGSKQTVEL